MDYNLEFFKTKKARFTYANAVGFCGGKARSKLCTYDQICPEGRFNRPVGRGDVGDMFTAQEERWVPIGGDGVENDWVYSSYPGTPLFPTCIRYSEMGAFRGPGNWPNPRKPKWGVRGGSTFGRHICCARGISSSVLFTFIVFFCI